MHLVYVDESGDDGFSKSGLYKHSETPSPFFTRTAVIVHDWKWQSIVNAIKAFRIKYSIPASEEIHATEILNGRSKSYSSPGRRTSHINFYGQKWPKRSDRKNLLLDLCQSIVALDLSFVGVVIDKLKIDMSKSNFRKIPKDFSWELLIERINYFLSEARDKRGMMISDATERNMEKYHRAYAKALFASSLHIKEFHFIETLLFEPSDSSDLLQISDVVAYAIGRKFNSNDDSFFDVLEPKFLKRDGILTGMGLKVWP